MPKYSFKSNLFFSIWGWSDTKNISEIQMIKMIFFCQALSISQSLNLSLSLRDRDRADTIITLYHTTPPETF